MTVSAFDEVINFWNKINNILPGELDYKPKNLKSTSIEEEKQIHSKYLSIRNVSSNTMSYNIDRTDGEFKVKWNNSQDEDEDFTFDIVYTNADFGSFTTTVIGEYIDGETEPLSGTWIGNDNLGDPPGSYNVIFEFKGMDCSCFDFSFRDIGTGDIYDYTPGNCIQKTTTANTYHVTYAPTSCPPTNGQIDLIIELVSKSDTELILKWAEVGEEVATYSFRPY